MTTELSEALSNSLSLSSILILTALGLAITFGVMRVINMAHGDLLMLGAYTALWVTNPRYFITNPKYLGMDPSYALFVAIPVSFLAVALFGYLLEICLIRFLYGRPLDSLLATWGVGLILQQVVLLTFGETIQGLPLPPPLQGGWDLGFVTIPIYRIFIVGITGLSLLALYLWFYKTTFGLQIRAVVQNRPMASAIGISTRRVDSLAFAFACGLAGMAGCIFACLYNVKYNMGADYIVDAFMTVILGGMGNLSGSIGGGAIIGSGNGFLSKILGNEIMARVLVLVVVVGFLLARPAGLFVAKERVYE